MYKKLETPISLDSGVIFKFKMRIITIIIDR